VNEASETRNEQRDWDAGWAQADATILEQDVWLLTDRIKRDYLSAKIPPGARTLEVGCGSAKLSALLAERRAQVTGVDLSLNALRAATKNFEALGVSGDLAQADAFQLPFGDSTFDAVLSTGLLEHFRNPVPVVREMARVLEVGGLFFSDVAPLKFSILRFGMYARGLDKNVTDEYAYTDKDISGWLEEANLRNVQVVASGLVPPLGLVRKIPAFRKWSFRNERLWTQLDGTRIAQALGFFYLAWANK
jgi:SAM-dependent methyltransferase